ncbi:polygalacturonase-like [Cylas formicarius]|uniref:polygalacturonase-like n=1 Tax=Cylas formicarius TaxID=197179 RepID=UPI0029586A62|nr:polygalacturonase-like [Cylas formicarius]
MFEVLCAVLILAVQASTLRDDGCTITEFEQIEDIVSSCSDIFVDDLVVPGGETLNLTLKQGASATIRGQITFGYTEWGGPLVQISGSGITVTGETDNVLDGQGQLYWDGLGEWGVLKPNFFNIQADANSLIQGLYVLDCPLHCVVIANSSDVTLKDWSINNAAGDRDVAPLNKYSLNTDGFDIWNSTNVVIRDMVVFNQDDCVSVRSGSNVLVDNVFCHGSKGISISVGFSNDSIESNTLENVTFTNSVVVGGWNAIHIRTHADSGEGIINNVTYENIVFSGLQEYGINIQQNYVDVPENSTSNPSPRDNIPITNLIFNNITGTVVPQAVPVYINCADGACSDWHWHGVTVGGTEAMNSCNYLPEGFQC